MKNGLKRGFCLMLCVCMALSLCVFASAEDGEYSLDAAKQAGNWVHNTDEETGLGYWSLDVVYCANPVDPALQHMVITAPEAYMKQNADGTASLNPEGYVVSSTGLIYTAATAPVLMFNTSGGYTSSKIVDVAEARDNVKGIDSVKEGYVYVTIQTRGKETKGADGKYNGQLPNIMVDLKAGVRYLKYNDAVLPGNSERIVSRGYSSGGAVSAMLGASGNSAVFEPYLKEIGAADATDDIFITLASAPITNLSSADASYEWYQHANEEYFLFNSMAFDREGNDISDVFPVGPANRYPLGSNMLGGAHEDELSDLLYDWYVKYVQGLGFDLGDDGRSGEFYEGFAQIYADALADFIARYDEVKGVLRNAPATAEEYLATLGEGWFSYDAATGKVAMTSLDDIIQNHVARKKMAPSLDSYNYKSNENDAFKDADGNTVHFSPTVRDALKTLMEDAEGTYNWTEEELAYITALYGDYAAGVTDEAAYMLEVMSPINYIVEAEGFDGATVSPYWRLRVGSEDGDHGAPAAWLIAEGLKKYQPGADVSVGIAWGMGHSLSELTEQDLYDYVAACLTDAGDKLPVSRFRDVGLDAWYRETANIVSDAGIFDGYEDGSLRPDGDLTWAEAVKLAVAIRQRHNGETPLENGAETWYSTYESYALENGILDAVLGAKANEPISRADYVKLLYPALPESEYAEINDIAEGAIPDVAEGKEIYAFYRAGILTGYDEGYFKPGENVNRAELVTVAARMIDTGARERFTLPASGGQSESAGAAGWGNGGGTSGGWGNGGGTSGGWGSGEVTVEAVEVMDGFYILNESRTRAFLAVGTDKALLVDTMYANSKVLDAVRKITELPVEVVITHGHPDHIGGIDAFDACYIHEADAYFLDGKKLQINYIKEGDELVCGDFTFEVIETPGHTRGSISLLDRAHKLLITGDAVQGGPIMMFDEECDMQAYAKSMEKLLAYQSAVEKVFAGHNDLSYGPEYIQYCHDDAAYLNGKLTGVPVTSWDGATRVDYQGEHVSFRLAA